MRQRVSRTTTGRRTGIAQPALALDKVEEHQAVE